MTMHALAPTFQPLDSAELARRIQSYVDRGWAPFPAAEAVARDLIREGLTETLLVQYATPSLYEAWEASTRRRATSGQLAALHQAGRRRVDCDALKRSGSLLESLVQIDGVWTRLGDLDRAACRRGATEQKRAALRHAHHARFLHAIAERLSDGQVVRDALGEVDLVQIFDGARPS